MPPSSVAAVAASMRNASEKDPEDLRIPNSSPFLSRGALPGAGHGMPGLPGMGSSALLDTYLSMIAAAGGDSAMAAALGSFPGRAAAFAAQAAAASQMAGNPDLKANGKELEERSISEDREEVDEAMPSDADISDNEDDKDDKEDSIAGAVEAAQAAATVVSGEDN